MSNIRHVIACRTLVAQVAFQQLEDEAPVLGQRWWAGMVLGLHGKARLKVRCAALRYWLLPMETSGK